MNHSTSVMTYVIKRNFSMSAVTSSKYLNAKSSLSVQRGATRNIERLLRDELRRREKEKARRGPVSSLKHMPALHDSNRTRLFNRKFQEGLASVMAQMPQLLGHGLSITKVNVTTDFKFVRVFWITTPGNEEHVENLLEENMNLIVRGLKQEGSVGNKLPQIVLVKDSAYLHDEKMVQLFDKLETGPDDPDESVMEDETLSALAALKLQSDVGGLDRDKLLEQIITEVDKSQASHRYNNVDDDFFVSTYRKSLDRDTSMQKEAVQKSIKQFKVTRRKLMRDSEL